ncbi:hypothetical protein [Rathayibacter sp. VKM Ac-2754]|uniref:hypothetical protein n=1 Tax=Rathayibacter sp. VKM Ac-2754 TaxID=2609251 RepID=UPI001358DC1B|nr:hypothetical protein [Rathayibacter sp. VKM Ac-2754]MWV59916.1 hypothetical protein [Rathayibacter sp. VKM Ac-2754]
MILSMKMRVIGAALAALSLTSLAIAPPAEAASGPGGRVITCTLKVHYPHNSSHVGGTINVTSDIKCTSGVDSIYSSTGLRGTQSANGWKQKYNDFYVASNAAEPCKNARYWGVGSGTVTFPAGFSPRVQNLEGGGAARTVDCSRSSSVDSVDSTAGDGAVYYRISATAEEGH